MQCVSSFAENKPFCSSHTLLFGPQVVLILCGKLHLKKIPGFVYLHSTTNPFRLPDIDGASSVQMLMHDFHDERWELK
jgi:hypothetical protein